MRQNGRVTTCVSSQVGCPLGCVFCATGQSGFTRNLSTGEIVAQAVHVRRALHATSESLRNIVVMGMGEPLLNYDGVMNALDILRDPAGMAIGTKRITLSTVGVIPGIVRLADEGRPFSLAVSLHAATQDERAALVPAARIWPLEELIEACRYYTTKLQRRIFFEWTLIVGRNDSPAAARQVVELLAGIPAHMNVIPLNQTDGYSGSSASHYALERFASVLRDAGVPITVRRRHGTDIAAGCGQLAGMAP
jgi:23S rRNA (adenine2503-C2)-methyltransferase